MFIFDSVHITYLIDMKVDETNRFLSLEITNCITIYTVFLTHELHGI
jgi:hypothetical protein